MEAHADLARLGGGLVEADDLGDQPLDVDRHRMLVSDRAGGAEPPVEDDQAGDVEQDQGRDHAQGEQHRGDEEIMVEADGHHTPPRVGTLTSVTASSLGR